MVKIHQAVALGGALILGGCYQRVEYINYQEHDYSKAKITSIEERVDINYLLGFEIGRKVDYRVLGERPIPSPQDHSWEGCGLGYSYML